MEQEYTSKGTSLHQIPAIYTNYTFDIYTNVLDFGCGAYFDDIIRYVEEKTPTVFVEGYDPYNRTEKQNKKVLDMYKGTTADYLVCSNVLNVIKEDECIYDLLNLMDKYADTNSQIIFSIHQGDRNGVGYPTPRGYQRNQKTKDYVEIINKVFEVVKVKGKFIECKKRVRKEMVA